MIKVLFCPLTTDMPEDAERKGLGTPATRAGIIEKLIKTGFVERSKRNLLPTKKGTNLVAVLPTALTSAKLTAEWEYKLKQIENGELDECVFMSEIEEFVKTIVIDNNAPKAECISLFPKERENAATPIGACPRCGSPIREWKSGFFCDTQTCGFKIWRNNRFWTAKRTALTSKIVAALLKDGYVKLKGLYSEKSRKLYDATVVLDDTGDGYVNFRLRFDKR